MIPKIIHYCWFGNKKINIKIKKYIKTWKKFFPDYEIIEWNEKNFDININNYVKEAYECKKYAFVSDYARLYALYNYGGIYFDTDVEVLRNFQELLKKDKDIFGFEVENHLMTAVMVSRKESPIIKEFLEWYENKKFIDNGKTNLEPNTTILSNILSKKGIQLNNTVQELEDVIVYPLDYFSGYDIINLSLNISSNTYTIHHYAYSWGPIQRRVAYNLKKITSKILGVKIYDKIRKKYKRWRKK